MRTVFEISERRACSIVQADRKMVRYRSRRPPETELRERLRSLVAERRRFGYRRLFVLLRRAGEPSGKNRIYRLYREEGLTVRKRRSRRRAIGTRAPILGSGRRRIGRSVITAGGEAGCRAASAVQMGFMIFSSGPDELK